MSSGIYIIKNTQNNKVYVGSSVNVKNREYRHFWMLGRGVHDNPHLQKSYNKYGKSSFIFEVVEICDESKLIDNENYYISNYKSNVISFGYNLATVNEFRRNTFNDEVKVKLSKYNLINKKYIRHLIVHNIQNIINYNFMKHKFLNLSGYIQMSNY